MDTYNTAHGTLILNGDSATWTDDDGTAPLTWTEDADKRGFYEVRIPGAAWQIDPAAGTIWVSERWGQDARHTFPPRMVR